MTAIALSRIHFPVTALGPGRRIGVWFQGCTIRCPGCISPDTWKEGPGQATVEGVIQVIEPWLPSASGLTISGGEPFDQPDALEALLRAWRKVADGDVLIFTGQVFGRVERWLAQLEGLVDAVVAGPYIANAPQTLALRGSDNQTLHCLTKRGQERFGTYERSAEAADRRLDIMLDADGTAWFAGIPERDAFERLSEMLRWRDPEMQP